MTQSSSVLHGTVVSPHPIIEPAKTIRGNQKDTSQAVSSLER
jgi:hypothetical protein